MNLFLIGFLLFFGGLIFFALTILLAYFFSANMVRSALTAGAISVGSLATQIPEKKQVIPYLFKQVFYWKSWTSRFRNTRLLASRAKASVQEIGFWRTTGKGTRYLAISSWASLRGFLKALLLPYAISAGLSVVLMVIGGFCMLIAFGVWMFF